MSASWKDTSSRSRGDKPSEPSTWTLDGAPFRVCVTRHRDFGPDVWILRADQAGIDMHQLHSVTAENAKREAIGIVTVRLQKWAEAFAKIWEAK